MGPIGYDGPPGPPVSVLLLYINQYQLINISIQGPPGRKGERGSNGAEGKGYAGHKGEKVM